MNLGVICTWWTVAESIQGEGDVRCVCVCMWSVDDLMGLGWDGLMCIVCVLLEAPVPTEGVLGKRGVEGC